MNHFQEIRQKLAAYEIDAMLLTSGPNRFYASGFHATDGVALVTRDADYYFTDSRYIEAAEKAVAAQCVMTTAERGAVTLVGEAVERHGIRTLGFEDEYMTFSAHRRWAEKLRCTLRGATGLLSDLRARKGPEELEAMTAAQRIAEAALEEVLNHIRPGVTEREIAALLTYRMLSGGAENVSFDPIVVSGPNSSMPHGVPGERPFQAGDFITMDFGCIYHGYCSDMTRTVALHHVTDEMAEVYEMVLAAQKAGIAAARAGVTGRAIDAAAREVIQKAGYGPRFGHSFGHSLGVEIHESPNASPTNDTPMPEGAVISAEPGIYLPGRFGVRIEDVIRLTAEGNCNLTLADKALTVL